MSFIGQKKLLCGNMNPFKRLPEFEREFERLSKKYRSLVFDLEDFEDILRKNPTGFGKNFVIMHNTPALKILKARVACESLRNRNIRIVYAYHNDTFEFMYIEIYFKGEKPNEDKSRVAKYIEKLK